MFDLDGIPFDIWYAVFFYTPSLQDLSSFINAFSTSYPAISKLARAEADKAMYRLFTEPWGLKDCGVHFSNEIPMVYNTPNQTDAGGIEWFNRIMGFIGTVEVEKDGLLALTKKKGDCYFRQSSLIYRGLLLTYTWKGSKLLYLTKLSLCMFGFHRTRSMG